MRRWAAATALALALSGCGTPSPAPSRLEPRPLGLTAPTYATVVPDGLLLRAGDHHEVVRGARSVDWLPDGRAVVVLAGGRRLWDPATGLGARLPPTDGATSPLLALEVDRAPGAASHLASYTPEGRLAWRVALPLTDNPAPDEDAEEVAREYFDAVAAGSRIFLRWHDGSQWVGDGDFGLLVLDDHGDVVGTAQLNQPIRQLWPSVDGSALLATRQVSGVPCGGCHVAMRLDELDPRTGRTVASYPFPSAYRPAWQVAAVDKVGRRVAVRFTGHGAWVLDDDGWHEQAAQQWWQGRHDRIQVRAGRLVWLHDGRATLLAVDPARAVVPGQLLPPAS